MGAKKLREDVLTETSELTGVSGRFESLFRRFRNVGFSLLMLPVGVVCCLAIGISLAPSIYLFNFVNTQTAQWPEILHYAALGCALSSGFLLYGFCLILVIPLFNFLNPFKVKTFRGPWFSLASIPWYFHNALTYMARYTFLEFITPTPLNILFYRMMGMKIGKGVVINTTNISDPCLITLGDYVTVGGSATLFAHSGQKGYLIIAPLTIGKGTTIGLKASIMGGSSIGEGVTIRPHAVVLPKTTIHDGETV